VPVARANRPEEVGSLAHRALVPDAHSLSAELLGRIDSVAS
jgi:hypothetical protein